MPRFSAVTDVQMIAVLKLLGFAHHRQGKGSHEIWRREADGRHTTVPRHRGETLKRRTVKSILDDAGIGIEDLRDLLGKI